jgi:hypothetical protein
MPTAPTSRRIIALAAATLAGLAGRAVAEPFDRRVVPADAKWVVCVDVDAARASSLGKAINDRLTAVPEYQRKIAQVSVVTGMTYPQDLHDVTLYGRAAGDDAVVVVAHAHMDRPRMLTALSTTPDHATHHVGAYDVVRWTDNGRTTYGAFHDDGTLVLARSEANVTAALDTIDGKSPAAAADGPFSGTSPATTRPTAGPGERPLLFLAVTDPRVLADGGFEVPGPLQQVEAARLSVLEVGDAVALRANLTTGTPDQAAQLRGAAEGLRAMLNFAASAPDARLQLKQAVVVLNKTVFGLADRTVTIDLSEPVETIRVHLSAGVFGLNADDDGGATTRPATRPAGGE